MGRWGTNLGKVEINNSQFPMLNNQFSSLKNAQMSEFQLLKHLTFNIEN
jgi:hypothetical protein